MNKIIYYYQTFNGIEYIANNNFKNVTHINVSSIHFGKNEDNTCYIHLNNNPPSDISFDKLWEELESASKYCNIYLMIGGAGGAYKELFGDFESYYSLLYKTLKSRPFISGVDLDIEESVDIDNIKMLMRRIKTDFGVDFRISMAPVSSSMTNDIPGMGNFIYKDLYNSDEGKLISHFNVQCYYDYSLSSLDAIIENGYPCDMIVMGMISSQNLNNNINQIENMVNKYGTKFGGVFNWEYFDSPPGAPDRPDVWCEIMNYIMNKNI
jgi:hypothetical protein